MAKILGAWKPRFIHADKSKKRIVGEAGFTAEKTHYDAPKPRTSFPVGHLTTGWPSPSRGTATSGIAGGPADQLVTAALRVARGQRDEL